jgi:benzoylformate decarboxylase
MRGHEAIIRQFLANGLDHMFGNPGTVEQGFLDALSDVPEMKYILTLQESIAVLCADGYARARFKPALVQIHSSPGLGNAIGNLYQAKRGHSPLVVIGGDAGIKYQAMDAQMAADLVAMAEPVTKWSAMVQHPSSLLRMVRRAIKVASTPPCGPVYLCLPEDILDCEITEDIFPVHLPSFSTKPSDEDLEKVASWIEEAENPILLLGDGVAWTGGNDEVIKLAETIGARVYSADGGEINFPDNHLLNYGSTGHMFGDASLPIMQSCDLCIALGCYLLPEVYPYLGDIFKPETKVIHIDTDVDQIAKNHKVDISFVAKPATVIEALNYKVMNLPDIWKTKANSRKENLQKNSPVIKNDVDKLYELKPTYPSEKYDGKEFSMKSGYFIKTLSELLPKDHIIFDEALTNSPPINKYIPGLKPGDRMLTRGGSLGTGFPGAIGAKLAYPEKEVIGFSGDGGSMYTIQVLWTAARHGIAAKFIVCQNRSYHLLQLNIGKFWAERGIKNREFPLAFDLSNPQIDFSEIAKSFTVSAETVTKPDEVKPAIERMLASKKAYLINLVLDGNIHPELVGVHCGQ